jgi:hypothetical protein
MVNDFFVNEESLMGLSDLFFKAEEAVSDRLWALKERFFKFTGFSYKTSAYLRFIRIAQIEADATGLKLQEVLDDFCESRYGYYYEADRFRLQWMYMNSVYLDCSLDDIRIARIVSDNYRDTHTEHIDTIRSQFLAATPDEREMSLETRLPEYFRQYLEEKRAASAVSPPTAPDR